MCSGRLSMIKHAAFIRTLVVGMSWSGQVWTTFILKYLSLIYRKRSWTIYSFLDSRSTPEKVTQKRT